MPWQYILPLIIVALICAALAHTSWQRKTTTAALPFAALMLAITEWTICYIPEITSLTLSGKIFWSNCTYIGISIIPIAWLTFASQYTGYDRWITKRNISLLGVGALLFIGVVWTDGTHHLFRANSTLSSHFGHPFLKVDFGPAFWVFVAYNYLQILIGSLILIYTSIQMPMYREKIGALFIGILAPWVSNAFYITDIFPNLHIDITPFAFTITGLTFGYALFRFQLLDLLPIARDAVLQNMNDGVIVLDNLNQFVDINPAAARMLRQEASELLGKTAEDVFANLPELVAQFAAVADTRTEIKVGDAGNESYYDIRISPVKNHAAKQTGRLIVFRDITQQKIIEEDLRTQKQRFENLVAVARATTERPNLGATLNSVLGVSVKFTSSSLGSLFLVDAFGNVTHSLLARGTLSGGEKDTIIQQVMEKGLAGWVVKSQQTVCIPNVLEDKRWFALSDTPYAIGSALVVPITSEGNTIGVLTLQHEKPAHYTKNHIHLMQAAADQMALALRNAQIYDEQRKLSTRQKALYKVLRTTSAHLNPAEIAEQAVNSINEETDLSTVAILLPNSDRTHLVVEAAAGALDSTLGMSIPITNGIVGRAFRMQQAQDVPNVHDDPDYIAESPDVQSQLTIPLVGGRQIIGILNIESETLHAFTPDDIILAQSLADIITLALENALLYVETQQRLAEQTALREAGETISSTLEFQTVLNNIAEQMAKAANATSTYISAYNPLNDESAVLAEYVGPNANARESTSDIGAVYPINDAAFLERMRIGNYDYSHVDALQTSKEERAHMEAYGGKTILYIPLRVENELIGFVEVWESRDVREFTQNEISLCQAIAQQAALAIQRARLFDALHAAKEAAEAANIAKSEFVSVAAHELKIPMTSIKGYSDLLKAGAVGAVNEAQHNFLDIIRANVDRMKTLVSDLSDVSRIESGRLRVSLENVNFSATLNDVIRVTQTQITERKQSLQLDIPKNLPDVLADRTRLAQILTNLISNAYKYTPEGGSIYVRAAALANDEDANAMLLVSVQDTGIGITKEEQSKLFVKFFRSDDQLARQAPGTGLGLNITKHLVELQGGEIWFESVFRKGTTFYVTLPLANERDIKRL